MCTARCYSSDVFKDVGFFISAVNIAIVTLSSHSFPSPWCVEATGRSSDAHWSSNHPQPRSFRVSYSDLQNPNATQLSSKTPTGAATDPGTTSGDGWKCISA
ncbi:hypothetical protein ACN47E_009832 [Coniothyrium glycines]